MTDITFWSEIELRRLTCAYRLLELQDQLFRNVYRVLRPPAVFFGTDSTDGWLMRLIHIGDTMILLDPNTLSARLQTCGFENVVVKSTGKMLRFRAYRNQ